MPKYWNTDRYRKLIKELSLYMLHMETVETGSVELAEKFNPIVSSFTQKRQIDIVRKSEVIEETIGADISFICDNQLFT